MTDDNYFIKITAPEKAHKDKPILLRGKFHIPLRNAGITARGSEVLKHIVLVVTRGGNYQTLAPFKNVIVFADDIKQTEDACSGFFQLDVFEKISFDGEGDYYILCSLGVYTSNIVKVVVN